MPTNSWRCDKCDRRFDTELDARKCEVAHAARIDRAMIVAFIWEPDQINYPRSIRVKFSDKHGDFARYELKHVGYVGA